MKRMSVVLRWSLRENLKSKMFLIFLGVMLIATIPAVLGMSSAFEGITAEGSWEEMQTKLSWIIGMTCYMCAFLTMGVGVIVLASDPITKEKARGTIESLMATPLKTKDVWLGKSLAAFFPSLILGMAITGLVVVVLNHLYIVPAIHHFVLPAPVTISSFLMVPLIILGLNLLVIYVAMTGNPRYAQAIAVIAFVAVVNIVAQLGARGIFDFTSWNFALINLGVVALLRGATIFLPRLLTKEKVVLSSKG
jgi:ABC-type Na+ efflux pump permease subunit